MLIGLGYSIVHDFEEYLFLFWTLFTMKAPSKPRSTKNEQTSSGGGGGGGRKRVAVPIVTNIRRRKVDDARSPVSSPSAVPKSPEKKSSVSFTLPEAKVSSPSKEVPAVSKSPKKGAVAIPKPQSTAASSGEVQQESRRNRIAVPIVSNVKSRKRQISGGSENAVASSSSTSGGMAGDVPAVDKAAKRVSVARNTSTGEESVVKQPKKGKRGGKKVHSKDVDISKMTMRELVHYNPKENMMKAALLRKENKARKLKKNAGVGKTKTDLDSEKGTPGTGNDSGSQIIAPQVKIGEDGQIILNEDSLIISAGQKNEQRQAQSVVYESTSHVTYYSYSNRTAPEKWSADETRKFYRAISQCGTDFSLIERMFPNRTRRQIKNKFKREEKMNKPLVESALRNTLPIDFNDFLKALQRRHPLRVADLFQCLRCLCITLS